jgi:hypothetical protein
VNDVVVVPDSSELVDVPTCKRAAGKGTTFIQHGSDLFDSIGYDIVPFTAIGKHLIVEVASQYVYVSVVETYRVRRSPEFQLVDQY